MAKEPTSGPKQPAVGFVGETAQLEATKYLPTELEPLEPIIYELPMSEP